MKRTLSERQIKLSDALLLIKSAKFESFEIHYRFLHGDVKGNVYYSDHEELTVEKFIEDADNYGSFWLTIYFDEEKFKMFQIVDDKTFEPL